MSIQRYSVNWAWQELETDTEGGWVKADVAEALYEALTSLRACIMETQSPDARDALIKTEEALAKARGES